MYFVDSVCRIYTYIKLYMLYTVLWIITLHVRLGQFSEHIVNQIATIVFWKYQIAVFPANKSGKQSSVAGKHLAHSLVLALPGGSCTSDDLRGFMTRMLGNCWGDVVTTQIIDGKILWNWPLEKHDLENKFPFQVARASCQLHGVQITWIFWVATCESFWLVRSKFRHPKSEDPFVAQSSCLIWFQREELD